MRSYWEFLTLWVGVQAVSLAIVPWFGGRFKLAMRDQKGSEVELSRTQARELRAHMHW